MNERFEIIKNWSGWLWHHTAAGVALVLIVGGVAVGYQIGQAGGAVGPGPGSVHDHGPEPQFYTCSMHPSVQLTDRDAKCPICLMDLIPVTPGGPGDPGGRAMAISDAARALAEIETVPVARFFPTAEVRLFGKVTFDETSVARLTSYFPGRIERLFVNYVGVPVTEGDHLAELYSPELVASFEELRQALRSADASGEASEFIAETLCQTLRAAREKLRLFGLTETQIDEIEAGTLESERLTVYAPIGGIVTHLAAREGDYLETGEPIATVADLTRLWLDLEAYESQLPLLRWGQPVTFTVEARPGETFEGRVSFIEPMIDDKTRTAAVRVAVDNTDNRLKPGMFATAVVRPRVASDGAVVSDELAGRRVGPMHPTEVKDAPGSCDICGMDLVTAESLGVVGGPEPDEMPLVVPRSAVLFTGKRSVVYVESPDTATPTYEGREVVLGPRAGEYYTIRSGLHEGESVVTAGAFRIDSAMQILAKPSMMMPEGGRAPAVHQHGAAPAAPVPAVASPRELSETFLARLDAVYAAYLSGQESLAADNLEGFLRSTGELGSAIESVDHAGLGDESLVVWSRAAEGLRAGGEAATIEEARAGFELMSDAVLALQDRFGHGGTDTLHVAFCPMAFDGRGADWVQRGTTVNNPYFGDAMLRCGEIRPALPPEPRDEHAGDGHD